MKPIGKWLAAIALVSGAAWYMGGDSAPSAAAPEEALAADGSRDESAEAAQTAEAFEQPASGQMLLVAGKVSRLLSDDREGSPHQRFIIITDHDQSLLIAHNLELAPRLDGLAVGDAVEVYGEYQWNAQGGVLHWTHDDPRGVHPAGYIQWKGSRYQ